MHDIIVYAIIKEIKLVLVGTNGNKEARFLAPLCSGKGQSNGGYFGSNKVSKPDIAFQK